MNRPGVSVVVAAFNEGPVLLVALERILACLDSAQDRLDFELLVVDDGSSDETPALLREFSAVQDGRVRVLTHETNRGLVAAMETGCRAASKETIAYLDADLSYEPAVVEALVLAKQASDAAVAIASPYMPGGKVQHVPFDRLIASRVANWILRRCSGGRLSTFTGMVRAYDASTLRALFSRPQVGEFNAWAVAALIEADRRIVEIPAALVWPPERHAAAPRLSWQKLYDRIGEVVVTARYLLGACRRSTMLRTGTLVLAARPTRPYFS
jgi:glycosyltransferase involved in cell wall biosynthesis